MLTEMYDVAIVGMGPAGLAAAAKFENSGLSIVIVDSGKSVHKRDRYGPSDATSGHGGAGLFSDGKFSFFPSATELWTLPRSDDLLNAYNWTCDTLGARGLDTPPFPEDPTQFSGGAKKEFEDWILKAYPCDYLSLEARLELVDDMVSHVQGDMFNECHVEGINYDAENDIFSLTTRDTSEDKSAGVPSEIVARRIIVTSGRFGPLAQSLANLTEHKRFFRLEVGFRIEQESEKAFFRNMKQLDPKLRFREADDSVEWRTFCVCRQGEAVLTETEGLWTVSGRSDCPPTGRSNSGFNTRIQDEQVASRTMKAMIAQLSKPESHFTLPMHGLLNDEESVVRSFDNVYGAELRQAMKTGLGRLANKFPDLANDPNAKLIGPTLEGVGWYPKVNGDLQLLDVPAFVAGDACGLFRGIVAAMISGHYSAAAILEQLQLPSYESSVRSSPGPSDEEVSANPSTVELVSV